MATIIYKKPPRWAPQTIASNARKDQWSEDDRLICPASKSAVFGQVPNITLRGTLLLPAGPIYLKYGAHFGANHGFGFQHIWAEHCPQMTDHDAAMEEVCQRVTKILQPNTPIFFTNEERPSERKKARVRRLHVGIVVIELRLYDQPSPCYSVVTGGFDPGNTKGSQVGALA